MATRQQMLEFIHSLPSITQDYAKMSDAALAESIRAMQQPAARKFAEEMTPNWRRSGNANLYGTPTPASRDFPTGGDGGRRQLIDKTSGDASLFDDDVSSSSTSWDRTRDDGKVKMSEDDLTMAERNQMIQFLAGATGMSMENLSMMNDLQLWSLYEKYANPDEDSDSSMDSYSSASSVPDLDRKRSAMVARERRRQKYDEAHVVATSQPNRPAPPRQMVAQHYGEPRRYASSREYQQGYSAGKSADPRPCPYRDDPARKDWLDGYRDGFEYAGHAAADKPRWATFGTTPSERGAVASFAELPLPVRKFAERNARALASAGVDYVGNFLAADAAGRRQMLADCQRHAG